jgi:hypothetical protein
VTKATAFTREPGEITPWRGPTRGFGWLSEVQPVIERHCVGCHDGGERSPAPDLRRGIIQLSVLGRRDTKKPVIRFEQAYVALNRYVHYPGPESDYRLTPPLDYHADVNPLVQMLTKGHHGVRPDDEEAWDRLITWIDLNTPCYGTWREVCGAKGPPDGKPNRLVERSFARRHELDARYSSLEEDHEAVPEPPPSMPVR